MQLQVISDLHLEFQDEYEAVVRACIHPQAKDMVLVIAGDLCPMVLENEKRAIYAFDQFSLAYKHVLYVPGNHEYFETPTVQKAKKNMKLFIGFRKNITILDNTTIILDGVIFLGGTLWGDTIADQKYIPGLSNWTTEEHKEFVRLLYHERPQVVITHHVPSMQLVEDKYLRSSVNSYFVSEMSHFMESNPLNERKAPVLWCFGHTHTAYNRKINDTHVLCNPLGYPHERNPVHWDPFFGVVKI